MARTSRARLRSNPPVKFIRRQGMRPLPELKHGGEIAELRHFVNVEDDHFKLAVSWLLGALRPHSQYPILSINGEQGGGKSTICRMLRRLVDPHAVEIRAAPGNQRDLVSAARHNWILSFDNLSKISDWMSDSMCRVATGGGVGGRKLYTDDDEAVFDATRPILLNGIPHLTERPDLADRVLALLVHEIPDDKRRDETELWAAFNDAHPRILGGLCDVLMAALARYPEIHLRRAPRMADFAKWISAAESALGWTEGAFLEVYDANRADAVRATVEADTVAAAIRDFATAAGWEGTATELLTALNNRMPETAIKNRDWPKTSHHFSGRLRRVAPDLRKLGVGVHELGRQGADRRIRWHIKLKENSVQSVRSVQPRGNSDIDANAGVNAGGEANANVNAEDSGSVRETHSNINDLNAPNAANADSSTLSSNGSLDKPPHLDRTGDRFEPQDEIEILTSEFVRNAPDFDDDGLASKSGLDAVRKNTTKPNVEDEADTQTTLFSGDWSARI